MKKIRAFLAALTAAMLCSCGHNAIVFGKGFGLRAGFDPEHMSADVSFIYGEQLTLAARDNLEIELVTDVEGGQEQSTADVKTGSRLKIRIGEQVNGYFVNALETGATADQISALRGKNTVSE